MPQCRTECSNPRSARDRVPHGGALDLPCWNGVHVMKKRISLSMALAALAVLVLGSALWAVNPAATTITISDLECQGCAKKVVAMLNEVPGVAAAEANVEAKTATVTPKA